MKTFMSRQREKFIIKALFHCRPNHLRQRELVVFEARKGIRAKRTFRYVERLSPDA
ncbi:MAG: hypothetical protein KAS88_02625 [Deltaproteobacteria bacterium]|nr:hypothetical protein [Deltaproteobacteria bacterium]